MTNKKLNHDLNQLAAMFCQIGKAAAQAISDPHQLANKKEEVAVAVAGRKSAPPLMKPDLQRL
ncbi:MAG TPA: hypothetical protein VNQ55_08195 [Parapedobacter sp.]|nr:hypothetical protein [Parapedobacter sp.]